MTSRERLLRTLRFESTDRVPISTYELVGLNPDAWENKESSYADLMDLIRRETDCIYMWGTGPGNKAEVEEERRVDVQPDGSEQIEHIVHTPKGDLTTRYIRWPNVHTMWKTKALVESDEDVERWLSIPFEPAEADVSGWFRARERVGDHGIVLTSIGDPICHVAELFEFGDFTVRAMFQTGQIDKLLDVFRDRVMFHLESLLKGGVSDLFRVVGPEYATPPYLPKKLFDRFATRYDKPMIDLMHEYGAFARCHCHGRVRDVLTSMIEMGADSTDPLEPPPQGDVPLALAKEICSKKLGIMGNIELRDLELLDRDDLRALIRETMETGKPGGGFVIMPTAAPITIPLEIKTRDNYFTFIETALEFGKY